MADNNAVIAAMAQAIQDLAAAQTAAANAAAAAAVAAVPPAVPPAVAPADPAAIPFAAWPGLANVDYLDYRTTDHKKIYAKAVTPMSTPYDLKAEGLHTFLAKVAVRARESNWEALMNVTDSEGVVHNLLTEYGAVTLGNCQATAGTYLGTPARIVQDSGMLFVFLQGSITDAANSLILINPSEYTVNNEPSGICFLKVIIGKATVDTIATVNVLRSSLANLGSKMSDLNSNIKLFNNHVTYLKNSLIARQEQVPELMVNLFKGYANAADEDFVRYIQNKRDSYEDGATMTPEQLMSSALNKYELKVEDNSWSVPDKKDERILALEAENATLKKKSKRNAKTANGASDPYAWKKIPPKNGETTKVVNKKKYHWCIKHIAWTIHSPEKCNLESVKEESSSPSAEDKKKELYLSRALTAITEQEDDDGDEED